MRRHNERGMSVRGWGREPLARAWTRLAHGLLGMALLAGSGTLSGSAFATSSGSRRTLEVPREHPTIQAAVDAAEPGDVVLVKKGGGSGPNGEYQENVVIEVGLKLVCRGAVIDGSTTATARSGADYSNGITVLADDVEIHGCRIQFAQFCDGGTTPACTTNDSPGTGIAVVGNGFKAVENQLIQNEGDGLFVLGHGVELEENLARGNGGNGFVVESGAPDRALGGSVAKNRATGNGGDGFRLGEANFLSLRRNGSDRNEDDGFQLDGDGAWISENRADGNDDNGFEVDGTDHKLVENAADSNADDGFVLGGLRHVIDDNRASENGDDGFCLGGEPPVFRPLSGATLSKNASTGNEDQGFDCQSCSELTLEWNRASYNALEGFVERAEGSANHYRHNSSVRNDADGFRFAPSAGGLGDDVLFEENEAFENGADGVDIDRPSSGFILRRNHVADNTGTGIENDAIGTEISRNRVRGNRTDIAGAGDEPSTPGSVGGFVRNDFRTGGSGVVTPGTGVADP